MEEKKLIQGLVFSESKEELDKARREWAIIHTRHPVLADSIMESIKTAKELDDGSYNLYEEAIEYLLKAIKADKHAFILKAIVEYGKALEAEDE